MSTSVTLSPSDMQGLSLSTLEQLERLANEKITTSTVAFYPTAFIIYLAILYFSAKATELILSRLSRMYNDMSSANQRTSVIYLLNILYTTIALALQIYASPALADRYTSTGIHCGLVAASIVSGLYLFELIYRESMRWPMLVHHFSTIGAISFVLCALSRTWHPAYIVTGLCWLFQATTEQSIFVGLFMYRMKCNSRTVVAVLRFAAIQSFILKFVFAIYLLVWWGEKQRHNKLPTDIAFNAILFIAMTILQVTQVYGSWVVWRIADSVKRESIAQAKDAEKASHTVQEGEKGVLEVPHFLKQSARTDSDSSSITCASEESPKLTE